MEEITETIKILHYLYRILHEQESFVALFLICESSADQVASSTYS